MTENSEPRPICFIAMPFQTKPVAGARGGAPAEVDFNALWDKAYRPAIVDAGFTAVRADFDKGSVIVKDMVERLAYADLVLADVSLPNGNVYYELGLRHAARAAGCISFAADWSNQLFDIKQFRSVRYPLANGIVSDEDALEIRKIVTHAINEFKTVRNPFFEFIPKSPQTDWVDDRVGVFRKEAENLASFQADLQALRLEIDPDKRAQLVRDEVAKLIGSPALALTQVAVEMIINIRDELGNGQDVLDFIDTLGAEIQDLPFVEEQRLLALAKTGDDAKAITHLENLVETHGSTPERLGLIGGRYKRLWRAAKKTRMEAGDDRPSQAERRALEASIKAYDAGMQLDLNEYYCSCNLAPLLMERGRSKDVARARLIDCIVVEACERVIKRGEDDEWTRPTLLGAAFRNGSVEEAERLADRVELEGAASWKLETTLDDLRETIARMPEGIIRDALSELLQRLTDLL
ncbi:MAG: tetratricopeptide repeat-containing protein [Pseudomonadota bacterium]